MANKVLQIIDGNNSREHYNQHEDAAAAAAVRVGMLLERTTNDRGLKAVQPHSEAGSAAGPTLVALAMRGIGMEPGGPDGAGSFRHQTGPGDTYNVVDEQGRPVDNQVRYIICGPGVVLHLPLAPDNTVGFGEFLTSNGDGTFRPIDTAGGETKADAVAQVDEQSADTSGYDDFGFVLSETF